MTNQIIPMLSYEDGIAAMEWLCKAFGFVEKTRWVDDAGRLSHGEIIMGSSIIMLATPSVYYQCPLHHRKVCKDTAKWYEVPYVINGVLVYVDDVKQHFENAQRNEAVILSGLESGGPGLRYRAEDPEGQRWMFIQKNND